MYGCGHCIFLQCQWKCGCGGTCNSRNGQQVVLLPKYDRIVAVSTLIRATLCRLSRIVAVLVQGFSSKGSKSRIIAFAPTVRYRSELWRPRGVFALSSSRLEPILTPIPPAKSPKPRFVCLIGSSSPQPIRSTETPNEMSHPEES